MRAWSVNLSPIYTFLSLKHLHFHGGIWNSAKLTLHRNNYFSYDLVYQVCCHVDFCFTCWFYNFWQQSWSSFPGLFSLLINSLLWPCLSSKILRWLDLPQVNYSFPKQTLDSEVSHDNISKLFSYPYQLLSTHHHHSLYQMSTNMFIISNSENKLGKTYQIHS